MICVTLPSGMVELPTFSVAVPLAMETELTVPETGLPLASCPWTERPMRLPAVATFWPRSTDCKVVVKLCVAWIDWIWPTSCIKSELVTGWVGSLVLKLGDEHVREVLRRETCQGI